jgi:hypothetical protein
MFEGIGGNRMLTTIVKLAPWMASASERAFTHAASTHVDI